MATVFDIPASRLLGLVKEDFKNIQTFKQPEWALFIKTGSHRERTPVQPDWWYMRGASILRRIYVDGPKGVSRLRTYYGGRKARGVKPHRFARGSGKIARVWLQLLEKEGFVKKEKDGRVLSAKGRKYLDGKSFEARKAFEKKEPSVEAGIQVKAIVETRKPVEKVEKKEEKKEELK